MDSKELEMWDFLVDYEYATEEELGLVCALCGTNIDTLRRVLYIRTGFNSLEQIKEEMEG